MTFFKRPGRYSLVGSLMVLALIVAGCSANSKDSERGDDDGGSPMGYVIGEPLADSTVAAIIFSEFGADTLFTRDFRMQLDQAMGSFPAFMLGDEQQEMLRRGIVEDFVLRHVFYGEMDKQELTVSDDDITNEIRRWRQMFNNDEEQFQAALAQEGLTEDGLGEVARDMLRRQKFIDALSQVSEPSAAERQAYREQQSEEIRAQHILFQVPRGAGADVEANARRKAEAVLDSLKKGADFAAMAQRHSEDPGSKEDGGDLNFFQRGQMVPEFEEAAFALKNSGDLTELVRTDFGFHIIRLNDRRQGQMMEENEAIQRLTMERRQEALNKAVDDLRSRATLRINPALVNVDLSTRFEGF
jgi:peptidyl-prolyl cis-trans isomerase C